MALMTRVGLHLLPGRIRAVRVGGGRPGFLEVDWQPDATADAAATLREWAGPVKAVAVAIDTGLLHVKRVALPPVPPAERRRMLELEPDRFFPVRGEALAAALPPGDDLAFAAGRDAVDEWIGALERIGVVEQVEPGPYALARALARGGMPAATVLTPGPGGSTAVVAIRDGQVADVRRMRGRPGPDDLAGYAGPPYALDPAADGVPQASALPAVEGVSAEYLTAWGAVLGLNAPIAAPLVTERLAERWGRRDGRRLATAIAACAAALVFCLIAVNQYRVRALTRVEADVASLRERARPVVALRDEAAELEAELARLASYSDERTDPLGALLALSGILPRDAYLRGLQASGDEWRIDGYAADAAALIPLLESSPAFDGARFLRATNRVRVGGRDLEDFTLAFRYVAVP